MKKILYALFILVIWGVLTSTITTVEAAYTCNPPTTTSYGATCGNTSYTLCPKSCPGDSSCQYYNWEVTEYKTFNNQDVCSSDGVDPVCKAWSCGSASCSGVITDFGSCGDAGSPGPTGGGVTPPPDVINVDPTQFNFSGLVTSGVPPTSQTLFLNKASTVSGALNWSASSDQSWCFINGGTSASGTFGISQVQMQNTISVSAPSAVGSGSHICKISFTSSNANFNPATPTGAEVIINYQIDTPLPPPPPPACNTLISPGPARSTTPPTCSNITSNSYTLTWNPGTWTGWAGGADRTVVRAGPAPADVNNGCVSGNCVLNLNAEPFKAGTTQAVNVTGLAPGTTYYNRIAQICNNSNGTYGGYKDVPDTIGWGGNSTNWTCTTSGAPACISNPNITSINGQATPVSSVWLASSPGSLILNWSNVAGVSSYIVRLYNWDNYGSPVLLSTQTISGTSATFSVTPGSLGTRYGYTITSNVANACLTGSMGSVNVFPPTTSCPGGIPPDIILSKSTLYAGDTATAYAPAGYSCSNYTSSNSSVATINSSTGDISAGSSSGTSQISATCTYQGGPTCAVSSSPITLSSNTSGVNYGFNISPTTMTIDGKVGQTTQMCATTNLSVTNTTTGGDPSRIITIKNPQPPFPMIGDQFVGDTGGYFFHENDNSTQPWGVICADPGSLGPGTYTDHLIYAMYNNSNVELPAPQKVLTVNINLTDYVYNYTASGALSFSTVQNAALPASKTITIQNTGDAILNLTATEAISWAGIDSASFTLNPAPSCGGCVGQSKTINVSINTTNLAPGVYNGVITFSEPNAGTKTVGVQYTVTAAAVSCTDPASRPAPTMTVPASVPAGTPFQITCGYGSNQDYIPPIINNVAPSYNCNWSSWAGANGPATFNCPPVGTAQNVTYTCKSQNYPDPANPYGNTLWCTLPAQQQRTVTITPAAASACLTNADCNDSNACTTDVCNNPGTGSASCSHTNNPVNGGWSGWSACVGGTQTRTCTVPAPSCGGTACSGASSQACVSPPQTVTVIPGSCGTVTSSPSGINCGATCQHDFAPSPPNVVLTATPKSQCIFIGWSGDCSGTNPVCTLIINSTGKTVTPIFGLKPFIYQEF